MYWWNVRGLVEDLIEQRVTSHQEFEYLLMWVVAVSPMFLFIASGDRPPLALIPLVQALVSFTIISLGLFFCFRANKRGDDNDFMRRIICIGWVVGMRVFFSLAFPGVIVLQSIEQQWGYSLHAYFNPIIQTIYFWRLHQWIVTVSGKRLQKEG